ncbi:type IV toxin-antitoxin system AbiEi family antitoxin domain-containing protein [Pseudonocardia yuanmonensis]
MDDHLHRLLVRQDGVLGLDQARELGLSARAVHRRVSSGAWRRVAPRVFLVAGHPLSDAARIRIASIWAGQGAVVSGEAAGWWHRMTDRCPPRIQVTVPPMRRPRPPEGIVVRRRALDPADVRSVRGVRITAPALTVLEVAAALPTGGSVLLDRALQRHVAFDELLSAYHRALGCTGAARMRALLTAAADRADSGGERVLFALLRRAGIEGGVRALPFGPWTIDLAFPAERVAVELDGWAWHVDAARFQNDRDKQNALVAAGWTVLRVTWHDVEDRPDDVVARIRVALRRAA